MITLKGTAMLHAFIQVLRMRNRKKREEIQEK
jgi:hypothetical protein